VQFRFERRHPDGTTQISDLSIGIEYAHVGYRISADEPATAWEFTHVTPRADPPTIIAKLVSVHRPPAA
jgi:hypothetical protein